MFYLIMRIILREPQFVKHLYNASIKYLNVAANCGNTRARANIFAMWIYQKVAHREKYAT